MEKTVLPNDNECLGVFRVSWVAYVGTFIMIFITGAILAWLYLKGEAIVLAQVQSFDLFTSYYRSREPFNEYLVMFTQYAIYFVYFIFTLSILKHIYRVFDYMNTILFIDNTGIWVHRGVFSWQKEINGVYWADASVAKSRNGLINLIFNAYPIYVLNRYTGATEVAVSSIDDGKKALTIINKELEKYYNQNSRK